MEVPVNLKKKMEKKRKMACTSVIVARVIVGFLIVGF